MWQEFKLGWWSAGITSAVACKMALERYDNVKLYYIETGSAHKDNTRFKADCEKWYGHEIIVVRNSKGYQSPIDVVYKTNTINSPFGAYCTKYLKKDVRLEIEECFKPNLFSEVVLTNQIFGFEFDRKQVNRAIRFLQQYPSSNALFPLIEKGITKNNSAALLLNANIELPVLYTMGYANNNCIGCVKGGMGYWNKIRNDFPETFYEMAIAERSIGHTCINGQFLDELKPIQGIEPEIVMPECGVFCEIDFADIEDKSLDSVMKGEVSIYQAAKNINLLNKKIK